MKVLRVLRGGTRNQSTADFSRQSLFVSGNRYYESTISNPDAAALTVEDGILVMRNPADVTQVLPITAAADLAKAIGISCSSGEVELAQNETLNINYCHRGEVDGEFLVLPAGVTIATLVGDKTLKDLLTGLGFIILNVTENSKFDN